jgi:DNA-binding PucR family transcriptional regulator
MSPILDQAIERLRRMPEERQELLARLMLHEMEEDERWSRSTEANAGKLSKLVDEVLEADDRGECEPLEPDKL